MPRGRPIGSDIRQRLVDILAVMGTGYGYELHKVYCDIFPHCTREVVYYHLRIGVKLGLFLVEKVVSEQGTYSWGRSVEKTYYRIGPAAEPHEHPGITAFFLTKGKPLKQTPAIAPTGSSSPA